MKLAIDRQEARPHISGHWLLPWVIIASATFLYRKRFQVSAQISLLRFGRARLIDECEAFKAANEALGTCCSLIKKDTPQHKVFWFRFYLRSKKVRRSPLFSKPIVLSDILMSQQEVKQVQFFCVSTRQTFVFLPRAKKISHRAVNFRANGENRIVHESFSC